MTISEWLNSDRNYKIGVALYDAYGLDALLKTMFEQGYSPLRAKRLHAELMLLKNVDREKPQYAQKGPVAEHVSIAAIQLPEQAAPEQDPYRNKWLPLYQEMNLLRHTLEQAPSILERGKMAFRILELEQECMVIWNQRDYLVKNGKELPEIEEQEIVPFADMNNLLRRIQTVRTFISKYSKPGDNPNWSKHLAKYKIELEALQKQLNQSS
jgi:hypothetical protein